MWIKFKIYSFLFLSYIIWNNLPPFIFSFSFIALSLLLSLLSSLLSLLSSLFLSSGEKQRIGVARAFLHYPKLLILDEPTSNLDSLNEGIILKSIIEEQKDKSVIIVSHRESTLDCVDELIKFK